MGLFFESIHQLEELKMALVFQETPRTDALACALERSHPERPSQVLNLASKYGFTPTKLIAIWQKYMVFKAQNAFYKALPEVFRAVIRDAMGAESCCPRCNGIREVSVPEEFRRPNGSPRRICPQCGGSGIVRMLGNSSAQRLVLESVVFTGRRAVLVQHLHSTVCRD